MKEIDRRRVLRGLAALSAATVLRSPAEAEEHPSRILLTKPTTFYVSRAGNNKNDGRSPAFAFETGEGAINHLAQYYDGGDRVITIQFSPEEHNAGISLRPVPGASSVVFQGDVEYPRNCPLFVTNVPGPGGRHCFNNPGSPGIFIVQGFWLQTLGHDGYSLLRTTEKGKIKYAFIDFGRCTGMHVMAGRGGHAFSNGDNTISGPAKCHYFAEQDAIVQETSRTIKFVERPRFLQAFARATQKSSVIIPANKWIGEPDLLYTPTHRVESMSYIGTNQQGRNYLPGNPELGVVDPTSMLD